MTSELTSESTSRHARSCVSSRSRADGEGPLILRLLLDLLGGSSPSARLGMTTARAFDKIQIAASLVALPAGVRRNLAGEFRLAWTAQNHATKSQQTLSRFRRTGGPEEGL